jgi:hypothetical protein
VIQSVKDVGAMIWTRRPWELVHRDVCTENSIPSLRCLGFSACSRRRIQPVKPRHHQHITLVGQTGIRIGKRRPGAWGGPPPP